MEPLFAGDEGRYRFGATLACLAWLFGVILLSVNFAAVHPLSQGPATAEAARQSEAEPVKTAAHEPAAEFKDCSECPPMAVLPAGRFTMGSPDAEAGRDTDEGPQHEITIARAFAVGKFEVTFAEWDACLADQGCEGYRPSDDGWGRGEHPVIHVSWNDTQAYVAWLSRKTGKPYRLLSESEWEYAARAGTATPYFWGAAVSHDYANYGADACCVGFAQGKDQWVNTAPAGSFPANAFGLHDMLGNVWEWTADCHNASYEGAPGDGSAWTGGDCGMRILRGGSWYSDPAFGRSAVRDYDAMMDRNYDGGFRVARDM